jgi:hypothetical protein
MKSVNLNLWVLICILCMAFGCGSESGSGPASGKKAVSTTKDPHGVGLLTNKTPGGPPPNIKIAPPAESDDDVILPPVKPGGKGITRGEAKAIRAKAAQVVLSDDDVVLPPVKPGGKGITRGEVKAIRAKAAQVMESDADVVLPPIKPGDKGITRGEIKARRSAPERGRGGPPPLP